MVAELRDLLVDYRLHHACRSEVYRERTEFPDHAITQAFPARPVYREVAVLDVIPAGNDLLHYRVRPQSLHLAVRIQEFRGRLSGHHLASAETMALGERFPHPVAQRLQQAWE